MNEILNNNRIDLKAMIVMFKAYQSLIEVIKNDIKKTSFDLNEFTVLEVIYHKKKLSVAEIKEKVLVANSSLTYILDKLEKKDLIKRTKSTKDRRITHIELTNKGLIESNNIFPDHYEVLKDVYSILTTEEKNIIVELLKRLGLHAKEIGGVKWYIFIKKKTKTLIIRGDYLWLIIKEK